MNFKLQFLILLFKFLIIIRRSFRKKQKPQIRFRANWQIRTPKIKLIDEQGKMLGIMFTQEALNLARSKSLDLVEVSPKENPPVCKILDFGQFKYKLNKKQKTKSKKVELKGIRLSLKIGEHDLEMRRNQAKKFLEQGHKVKLELQLKGREKNHLSRGFKIMQDFIDTLTDLAELDQNLAKEGGKIIGILRRKAGI